MNNKAMWRSAIFLVVLSLALAGCGQKKTTASTTNTPIKVVIEAPYVVENGLKVYALKLVNGLLDYKTMTLHPGDRIEIRLTSDGQPVDFKFQEVPAASTNGIFGTDINTTDPGGTYHLVCVDRECGSITVTVPPGTNGNTNTTASNTNQTSTTPVVSQISKAEMQQVPAGTTFGPGLTLKTTTAFNVGDQFGLNVVGTFNPTDLLTYAINDQAGVQVIAPGPNAKLTGTSNGSCCYGLPSQAGNYTVDLLINGVKATSIPITLANP